MTTTALTCPLAAAFLDGPAGAIFQIRLQPEASAPQAQVIIVPPFGEEMNRSRRFLTKLARALAARGFAAAIPDLHGTGDSAGDFEAANWDTWIAEIAFQRRNCAERADAPLLLLGVRTGALLAAESLAREPDGIAGLVCVQGVANGGTFLNQLLRVRVAASMARGQKESSKGLRARLTGGETLEVGGYAINPALACALESRRLDSIDVCHSPRIGWYEVVSLSSEELPPPSPPKTWPSTRTHVRQVRAEAFWSLQEPVVPANLVETLCDDLERWA